MAAPLESRRLMRCEYDRLVELGVLHEDDPVELIGGAMIVAEPKGTPHATAVRLVTVTLQRAFDDAWLIIVQDPIALDAESEPEPDVAIVPGRLLDYRDAHPARAALVVEVAESSLLFDRQIKGSLYARAGVPEYWIVNLVDRGLEIYREPMADTATRFGWRYGVVAVLEPDRSVSPLACPEARIAVGDLLP